MKAILTQDDLPAPADSAIDLGPVIKANPKGEKALTNDPFTRESRFWPWPRVV